MCSGYYEELYCVIVCLYSIIILFILIFMYIALDIISNNLLVYNLCVNIVI